MLNSFHISGSPAFGTDTTVKIGPLPPVTFLFGANGSGKTTISRALADLTLYGGSSLDWEEQSGPLSVRVYNRDYVDSTLSQAANLPGVFLLGEMSTEAHAEMADLRGSDGTIQEAKTLLGRYSGSRSSNADEQRAARNVFKERAWEAKANVPSVLQPMFIGFKGSQEKLVDEILRIAAMSPDSDARLPALAVDAAEILDDTVLPEAQIPTHKHDDVATFSGAELLPVAIVGRTDVRLAGLIQRLQNADWVEHGRPFLDDADGLCPFCQQRAPDDLEELLNAYFDETYTTHISALSYLRQQVTSWGEGWRTYLSQVRSLPAFKTYIEPVAWDAAALQLDRAIDHVYQVIDSKIDAPSTLVVLESPREAAFALQALIDTANAAVVDFNNRVRTRGSLRTKLIAECWKAFVVDELAVAFAEYDAKMTTLGKAEGGILAAIGRTEQRIEELETRLRHLEAQTTSSRPIIDNINQLLVGAGFHSFTLGESTSLVDGYTIRRPNGDVASDTLSEGERTFISFLYYAQSLDGTSSGDGPSDLLAVIDDPISSLDSDVLYAVSTIVRGIIRRIGVGEGRVRQLILLTHNAHFHKEVIYESPRASSRARRKYGLVRKHPARPSVIELSSESPIQTAYGALWDEVKRAHTDQTASVVGVQNVLRRIIETYFKVLGSIDTDAIVVEFSGADRAICEALFSWVNAGSHTIFDDLHYAQSTVSLGANLDVFRRIFEMQSQEGHYRMMMGLPMYTESIETVLTGETPAPRATSALQ